MASLKIKSAVSGALAGAANGFFGAGGGMFLIPLFTGWAKMPERRAFATSIAVILPLCVVSAIVYFLRGSLDLSVAWPYFAGGIIGGFVGGRVFKKVPVKFLRKTLALFILYGGIRYFL